MTRFARAKGSKSSNERLPEEATSWSEMKQQLLEKNKEIENGKKRREVINQRNANYKAFLDKREEDENKNSKWADFPGVSKPVSHKRKTKPARQNRSDKISNTTFQRDKDNDSSENEEFTLLKGRVDKVLDNNNINKSNKTTIEANNDEGDSDAPPEEESIKKEIVEPVIRVKKQKKKLLKIVVDKEDKARIDSEREEKSRPKEKRKACEVDKSIKSKKRKLIEESVTENDKNNNKKAKKNKKPAEEIHQDKKIVKENLTEKDLKKIEKKKQKRFKQVEKKKRAKAELKKEVEEAKNALEEDNIGGNSSGNTEHEDSLNKSQINSVKKTNTSGTFSKERFNNPNNSNKLIEQSETENDKNNTKNAKKNKKPAEEIHQDKKIVKENLTEKDLKKIEKKKQKRFKQVEKKKRAKAELKKQGEEAKNALEQDNMGGNSSGNTEHEDSLNKSQINSVKKTNTSGTFSKERFNNPNNSNNGKNSDKKKIKLNDKEKPARRKPLLPHKMFINGKELEVDYVDGFPVKKQDAERLKKLRKEMISKGLPRSEINAALKLERRRAEKAFANEKKKVCFQCRISGHNLSECPELNKDQVAHTAGSGICFKCGSTEHTHFECKVVRGQEYKFAQCFICKDQGHIARQCPDNARGLYPKGGSCNMCGDVTHLKKDCPKYQAQQQRQEDNFRLETFGDSNPDNLEEQTENISGTLNKRQNKIIKF